MRGPFLATVQLVGLRSFSFRLAAMFWILPRFGKIGVRIFQQRVLIAMPQLFLHAGIPFFLMILSLGGALPSILILRIVWHQSTSWYRSDKL
jgi:hypothetical protein